MQVGVTSFWQHGVPGVDDHQFVHEELQLAVLAEELGYDFVAMTEHHFEDYSMSVDNLQSLSYLAAKTERIGLMTAVVVLPWHNPIRVAEKLILLDHLSNGRAMFGMGRGLAPKEYAAFGVDQGEARERFDEMALMITRALETGVIEGDGPLYPLAPHELRPRPLASFKDRIYGVAGSPSSAEATAKVGARLIMNVSEEIEKLGPTIELWQKAWRDTWDSEPPPPVFSDFTFCTRDPELTQRARTEWYPKAWDMTLAHYQLGEVDFTQIKGYEAHKERTSRPPYADTQVWGTPEEIIEGYRQRIEVAGTECTFTSLYRFGGMPADVAETSMRLFATEVLPEIKKLGTAG